MIILDNILNKNYLIRAQIVNIQNQDQSQNQILKLNTKDFRNRNKGIHNIGKIGVINMKMINNNKEK
jgi:hypothetical protein